MLFYFDVFDFFDFFFVLILLLLRRRINHGGEGQQWRPTPSRVVKPRNWRRMEKLTERERERERVCKEEDEKKRWKPKKKKQYSWSWYSHFSCLSLSLSLSLFHENTTDKKTEELPSAGGYRRCIRRPPNWIFQNAESRHQKQERIHFSKKKKDKKEKKMPAYSGHNQVQSDTNYKNALSSSLSRVANWRTAFTCSTLNEHWMANSQLGAFYTLETHPSSLPQKYDNRRLSYWFQICVCQSAGIVDAVFWECSR